MHSNGRGEETPEPYRGVVLPAGQQQPPAYGDHVQPAAGSPWGGPGPDAQQPHGQQPQQAYDQQPYDQQGPGQQGLGPQPHAQQPPFPEPADATQMLPPYPAAMPPAPGRPPNPGPAPVPVADATQMLPPYPGDDPAAAHQAPQQPGMGHGPVPPLPPVPPVAPQQAVQAAQGQSQGQGQGHDDGQQGAQFPPKQGGGHRLPDPPPAEATQALPLSIFHDDPEPYEAPYDGYDQQGAQGRPAPYGQQPQQGYGAEQGYGQGSYDAQQQYGGPAPQQPYEQSYEQQDQQTGPGHDSDYDHLFRSDVPSPEPLRQRIIQPPSQKQQQQQQQQYGGQPPQQPYEPGYGGGYDDRGQDGGGRRRMSPAVIIGIAVAGIVVAGLVVGGLMSGGGSSGDKVADKSSTPASADTKPSASASGTQNSPAVDSAAKQQAQALDSLLKTSGASRSSVVGAVESIKNCKNLGPAATDLRSASTQRNGLVTSLGSLSVDRLPNHQALTDALTKAWQASAAADSHYANWADQAAHQGGVCKGGHARNTGEAQSANASSGTATKEKKHAVKLWNSIAKQYGLTQRQYSQL